MANQTIAFSKASGAGNDFVIINNADGGAPADKAALAVALCSRPFGVGADGLLVIERSVRADFLMRYYNADGSYGGMCGNGGRCAARYAVLNGLASSSVTFEALDYVYQADVHGSAVRLQMKDPTNLRRNISLGVGSVVFLANFINTGSPHVVIFDENLDEREVVSLGRTIRRHHEFSPDGTNVNFVQLLGGDRIAMRTYERGVEAETLACGTGSVASAVISSLQFGLRSPVHVQTRGGEALYVEFKHEGEKLSDVVLVGSAHMLYSGVVQYDEKTKRIVDSTVDALHNDQAKQP